MIDEKRLIESINIEVCEKNKVANIEFVKGFTEYHRILMDKIKTQEKTGDWISCTERLPSEYCRCLVTVIKEQDGEFETNVREDTYIELEGVWGWHSTHEGITDNIIAWQPLPSPYERGKILYLITADTYDGGYGSYVDLFGIADSKEELDKIAKFVESKGYEPIVNEVELNKNMQKFLGGYAE